MKLRLTKSRRFKNVQRNKSNVQSSLRKRWQLKAQHRMSDDFWTQRFSMPALRRNAKWCRPSLRLAAKILQQKKNRRAKSD